MDNVQQQPLPRDYNWKISGLTALAAAIYASKWLIGQLIDWQVPTVFVLALSLAVIWVCANILTFVVHSAAKMVYDTIRIVRIADKAAARHEQPDFSISK